MKVLCDNKAAMSIAKNPIYHDKTKYVEIDCHFIKEKVDDGVTRLEYMPPIYRRIYSRTK